MLRRKVLSNSFLARLIIKTNTFRTLLTSDNIFRLKPLLYRQGVSFRLIMNKHMKNGFDKFDEKVTSLVEKGNEFHLNGPHLVKLLIRCGK